MADVSEIGGHW